MFLQDGEQIVELKKSCNTIVRTTESPVCLIPPNSPEIVPDEQIASEQPKDTKKSKAVNSPMVGTFYGATAPGAKPLVKVGDTVVAGQVVCIIEAMKLMNEIESEVSGKVTEICVEDGQPVEYGQVLMYIE